MINTQPTFARIFAVCAALVTVSFPFVCAAQEGISIETFRISGTSDALFETVLPTPKQHLDWQVGALLSHAQEPVFHTLRIDDSPTQSAYPVWAREQLDLYASLGLFKIAEIALVFPVILHQQSLDPISGQEVQPSGTGDPRLEVKVKFLERPHAGLGIGAALSLPLGHYLSSGRDFMGSRLPTVEPKLLLESPWGPVILAANLGFLVRETTHIGAQTQTHALTWNAGVAWDIDNFKEKDGFRLLLEANGEMDVDVDYTSTPVELIFGFKYRGHTDTVFSMGAGPGISRGLGTPTFRAFAGVAFDPITRIKDCAAGPEDMDGFQDDDHCIDPDNDGDGFADTVDKCPNEAEDIDSYKDDDGCPDLDNDGDTIPDGVDACPMIPEDKDQYEDEDGCPEEGPGKPTVKITDTQLLISSKIYFDYDKVVIKSVSYPILDAVAETIIANPYIEKIRIEGHTDNEGTQEYNQDLSEKRAQAVMEYLIEKGVPAERLSFKGYGFSRPKASNDSEVGKAINRRVEFTIERGGEP